MNCREYSVAEQLDVWYTFRSEQEHLHQPQRVTLARLVQMILGALAALAVAGVAAGSLYMRQHLTGRKPESTGAAKQVDEGQRKDLRRKRGYMLLRTSLAPLLPCTMRAYGQRSIISSSVLSCHVACFPGMQHRLLCCLRSCHCL